MTDFIDIKTLAICYGLCCGTQLVAFLLQCRINRGGQGLAWWALGSALMVFGFFINSFRDVEAVSSVAIFIYAGSFILCFLSIYIGLAEFVENKKLLRPVLLVAGMTFAVLCYFVLQKRQSGLCQRLEKSGRFFLY